MDPLNPIKEGGPRSLRLGSAWMGLILVTALFVDYRCFDAGKIHLRKRWLNKMREEAGRNQDIPD